jgi:transposase
MTPHEFIRIEIGRIARQEMQRQLSLGRFHVLAHTSLFVRWQTGEHQMYWSPTIAHHRLQQFDKQLGIQCAFFVCALRATGLMTPLVLDGPMNGPAFRAWVQQALVPELQPGDIVVLDNLSAHKVAGIAEAIHAAGAQLRYLPPYSPDYNLIEQVFARLKTLLRKAAKRTVDALWFALGDLIDCFTADEWPRYICHAGYGRSA